MMQGLKWGDRTSWIGRLRFKAGTLEAEVDGQPVSVSLVKDVDGRVITNSCTAMAVDIAADAGVIWLQTAGRTYRLERIHEHGDGDTSEAAEGAVRAPMPGNIIEVLVELGATVVEDQVLVRMESMKLQVDIRSPRSGTITQLAAASGSLVDGGDILAVIGDTD